eukprot:6185768-Pleurochrysis_carterae.AAC.2
MCRVDMWTRVTRTGDSRSYALSLSALTRAATTLTVCVCRGLGQCECEACRPATWLLHVRSVDALLA